MRSRWCWCGASALLLPSLALGATVLERTVRHTVKEAGVLRAAEIEKIRLDSERDVELYDEYVVALDDNVDLVRFSARATKPGGDVVSVSKDDQDVRQVALQGELHSSQRFHVAPFPALPVGSVLDLGHEVETRMYFPAARVFLRGADAVERLRVEVGGAAGLRWVLTGPVEGIEVAETADGLTLSATKLAGIEPPEDAPSGASRTVLHYAWGPRKTWRDVGDWYEELIRDLPRRTSTVAQKQSSIGGDASDRWAHLSRLLSYCQKNVRYVAVEVGVGGFKPTAPADTLDRQWGDCKDKSFLLLDLLGAAGIEAYPAMILSSYDDRVDPSFPTPFAFNHVIVALPVQDWMNGHNAPISNGYLFVDPTQTRGGAGWLGQATQGQHALVVRGFDSELVRTPVMADHERRTLAVALRVAPTGEATGDVELQLTGDLAAAWDAEFDGTAPVLVEGRVRDVFDDLFPGGTLSDIVWKREVADELPVVQLRAAVRLPGLVEGDPGHWSFVVAGHGRTPEPRLLSERTAPIRVVPHLARSTWTVRLPDNWCVPEDRTEEVKNDLGTFRQSVDGESGVIRIERSVDLLRRWVDPDEFEALRELSLSEHRTLRRRIRADCSGG